MFALIMVKRLMMLVNQRKFRRELLRFEISITKHKMSKKQLTLRRDAMRQLTLRKDVKREREMAVGRDASLNFYFCTKFHAMLYGQIPG